MRERDAEGLYYDKYGPTVLCGVLFLALATNIGLRVSQLWLDVEEGWWCGSFYISFMWILMSNFLIFVIHF